MKLLTSPHTAHAGLIVVPERPQALHALEPGMLKQWLITHGYLVLRGFDHSIDAFSRLVRQSSSRISLDPARSFDGDTAQKVDAGLGAVGLHCENGNSPFWPDLCWFYCQVPPARGSQTTLCDGKAVYGHLAPEHRAAFSERDILYARRVEAIKWKTYAFHALAHSEGAPACIESVVLQDLVSLTAGTPGAQIELNADDSITYRFRTPAVRNSRLSDEIGPSFANSIFGPSNHYEAPRITFADGEPIDPQLLLAVEAVCERFTVDVGWQHGDVVLIDNTRVMHGRRAIDDPARTIFNALSYAH
ncbi:MULTISPECIES: TauD/TfdA family dioxygenase [Pseudomonas]|uniref:TauD/TfdA family dioxygenase n=1 Tax=Pseudomonas azadiae TaxID=2843612 RepID=A0ABS6NX20_9PSED|nr:MULTISPECIES: TauD/TfdA family dioxygenase [Pseudomonas]MBV4452763.1 TauD/TfdA family dioxygenase [Pseudomonas azadiae]NMF42418.1 TauD/TfdA family dioxygenase [Pseudomonas sp. SWRI 103]